MSDITFDEENKTIQFHFTEDFKEEIHKRRLFDFVEFMATLIYHFHSFTKQKIHFQYVCNSLEFDPDKIYNYYQLLNNLTLVRDKVPKHMREDISENINDYMKAIDDGNKTLDQCIYEIHSKYTEPFFKIYRKKLNLFNDYLGTGDEKLENYINGRVVGYNEIDARAIYYLFQTFKTFADERELEEGTNDDDKDSGVERHSGQIYKFEELLARNHNSFKLIFNGQHIEFKYISLVLSLFEENEGFLEFYNKVEELILGNHLYEIYSFYNEIYNNEVGEQFEDPILAAICQSDNGENFDTSDIIEKITNSNLFKTIKETGKVSSDILPKLNNFYEFYCLNLRAEYIKSDYFNSLVHFSNDLKEHFKVGKDAYCWINLYDQFEITADKELCGNVKLVIETTFKAFQKPVPEIPLEIMTRFVHLYEKYLINVDDIKGLTTNFTDIIIYLYNNLKGHDIVNFDIYKYLVQALDMLEKDPFEDFENKFKPFIDKEIQDILGCKEICDEVLRLMDFKNTNDRDAFLYDIYIRNDKNYSKMTNYFKEMVEVLQTIHTIIEENQLDYNSEDIQGICFKAFQPNVVSGTRKKYVADLIGSAISKENFQIVDEQYADEIEQFVKIKLTEYSIEINSEILNQLITQLRNSKFIEYEKENVERLFKLTDEIIMGLLDKYPEKDIKEEKYDDKEYLKVVKEVINTNHLQEVEDDELKSLIAYYSNYSNHQFFIANELLKIPYKINVVEESKEEIKTEKIENKSVPLTLNTHDLKIGEEYEKVLNKNIVNEESFNNYQLLLDNAEKIHNALINKEINTEEDISDDLLKELLKSFLETYKDEIKPNEDINLDDIIKKAKNEPKDTDISIHLATYLLNNCSFIENIEQTATNEE